MPHLTYKGPFYERKSPDPKVRAFRRKERREVSQEWLNAHRRKISDLVFLVEGDEGVHIDEGNDGIPDMSWTKAKNRRMVRRQRQQCGWRIQNQVQIIGNGR